MKKLLKNGNVINVFTGEITKTNVLIEDEIIAGVGEYYEDADADIVEDVEGHYICPSFIDGHIHIESTMLTPYEFARVCVTHGTGMVIADPHEITNVAGIEGFRYMLEASRNLPVSVKYMVPSCVPATMFDESYEELTAKDLKLLYEEENVLGLAEMMNYPGVVFDDKTTMDKIKDAKALNRIIDGHAPLLSGKQLDKYIAAGIRDDHECTNINEAIEKISKGQYVLIREGTSIKNLNDLIELFDEKYRRRCLLVTDDKHTADLLNQGHIDALIRMAVKKGKNVVHAIQMATIQAAECFRLNGVGAIAPGYEANLLLLNDLETVNIRDVYYKGKLVVDDKKVLPFEIEELDKKKYPGVFLSFNMKDVKEKDFFIESKGNKVRVIELIAGQALSNEIIEELDFENNNGVDVEKDILKLAVIERHHSTGNIGLGYIKGIGIKRGAIAASVSHDSHNLIVVGTNDKDMMTAANHVKKIGGGMAVADNGVIIEDMPLPVGGLMSDKNAYEVSDKNRKVREAVHSLGSPENIEAFMSMAFVSLTCIPKLKLSTKGLVDVDKFEIVPLFID